MIFDTGKRINDVNFVIKTGLKIQKHQKNMTEKALSPFDDDQKQQAVTLYKETFLPELKKAVVKAVAIQIVAQGVKHGVKLGVLATL